MENNANPNSSPVAAPAGAAATGAALPAQPAVPPAAATQSPVANPQEIASALMSALESRQKRVEVGVTKSMAEQYGMTDDEIGQILTAEKAKRAAQIPPELQNAVQEQIGRAHALLIAAEVKSAGAGMGLLDPDAALALMDQENVKVDEKGGVAGVKEALEALKEAKPYLFSKPGAWGVRQGGSASQPTGVEAAFLALNPELNLK